MRLREIFLEPAVRGVPVDDDSLIEIHAEISRSKPLLRSAFKSFYTQMIEAADHLGAPTRCEVELGSGGGFLKDIRPSVITTDVRPMGTLDRALNAEAMDIRSESVSRFYAINVFHHLPNPRFFFKELIRVLEPKGVCILIEPHTGLVSSWLHSRIHEDEYFDITMQNWERPQKGGPMSGANQALADIVFERDRHVFQEEFGSGLRIASTDYCMNGLRYLFSGGVNFRQLVPTFCNPLLCATERAFAPVARHWSLHQIIALQKNEPSNFN